MEQLISSALPCCLRGREDRLHVDVVGLAGVDEPPRGMHEDVHPRVAEPADDPPRHRLAVLLVARVDRAEAHVELGQQLVGKVHRAVGEDVALAAREDPDAEARLHRADLRDLHAQRRRRRGRAAIVDVFEWSDTMMYSWPRASAASIRRSSGSCPSDQSVCACRSPRRSRSVTSAGSAPARAASISPPFSRSSGGIHGSPIAA